MALGLLGDVVGGIGRGLSGLVNRGMNNSLMGVNIDPEMLTQQQRSALRSQFLMNLGAGIQQGGNIAGGVGAFQQQAVGMQQQMAARQLQEGVAQIMGSGLAPEEKYRSIGDLYSRMGKVEQAGKYYDVANKLKKDQPKIHSTEWVMRDGKPVLQANFEDGTTKILSGDRLPKIELANLGGTTQAVDLHSIAPGTTMERTLSPAEAKTASYQDALVRQGDTRIAETVRHNKVMEAQEAQRLSQDDLEFGVDDVPDPNSRSILAQTGLSYPAFLVLTGQAAKLPRDRASRAKAFNEAQKWANKRDVDVSTFISQYQAYNTALSSNIDRLNRTKIMEAELEGTIENLQDVVKSKDLRRLNFANVARIWAGQEMNDPLAQQYAMHLYQLRNELAAYGAATQGRSGNQITLQDMREAESTIRNGIASGSLSGLASAVKNSTRKMDTVMQRSVDAARKSVWELFGVGENYKPKTPGARPPLSAFER
jgi:tetratricopeptide (TPR) repeat protein